MAYIKPQTPIINWGHSLTKGLVFDAPFFERSGTIANDVVGKTQGAINASGATWDTNLFGSDLDFSAAASKISYTPNSSLSSLTTLSLEFLLTVRTNGGGTAGRILLKGGTNTYFMVFCGASALAFQAGWTSVGQWNIPFPTLGTFFHLIITYDATSTANNPVYYLNGVSQTVTRTSIPSGSLKADDATLFVGNRSGSDRNYDGKIAYVRIWNRVLNAQEGKQLYQNPWQIYNSPLDYSITAGTNAATPVTSKVSNANIQSLGNLANLQTI